MGTRADNHDGSCREVLTGKHAGKWRGQFNLRGQKGLKTRISRLFSTKTEAKSFLHDLRRGVRIENARRSRELTLGEWFDWLAENDWPESIEASTIGYRRGRFRKYIQRLMGHIPLSRIDALQVRAVFKRLREDGASESLLIAIKSDLVRAFNQAITPYQRVPMTSANPFRLPLAQATPRQATALTPGQVRAAVVAKRLSSSERAMLALFFLAGLRLGEVMAITAGQIRLDADLIVIDRAVRVEFGGKQSVGLPKGKKTRTAVMCRTLKAIVAPFIAEMAPEQYLWSAEGQNKPRMKKRIYDVWKGIRAAAGLPPDMSPHDCRLTHINIIEKLMPNVSVSTLKEHVGHAATGVTEANYTRPISTAQSILRDELDRIFASEDA